MDRLEITITWHGTVLDVRHLRPAEALIIAEDDAVLGGLLPTEWRLAELTGGAARLRIPSGVAADVLRDGAVEAVPPADGARGVSLAGDARARMRLGDAVVYFAVVPQAPALAPLRRGRALWQGGEARSLGAAALMHGLFFALALSVPVDAAQLSVDGMEARPEWVEISLRPELEKPEPAEPGEATPEPGGGDGPATAHQDPAPRTAPGARADAGDPQTRKKIALDTARDVSQGIENALGEVMGTPTLGLAAHDVLNAMNGTVHGDQLGMLGRPDGDPLGSPWGTPGGDGLGGPPGATIGLTGLDRRLFRRGPPGARPGGPEPRVGDRAPKAPKAAIVPLDPKVSEGLSREEIQRVIRRFRARYRYCYEKALQTEKGLNGKVSSKFTIGPDGAVIAALIEGSTLQHAEVEACLVQQLKRTAFPAPRGRGVVVVRYPFLFKRAGG
ncbi:MAG: AgmX/PglI C-terminal domain-containing protein [Myxococcales bacterium]|nr:AgmX/PglI C-terminal domain-containing protein [Myxococcales bacterium]